MGHYKVNKMFQMTQGELHNMYLKNITREDFKSFEIILDWKLNT